VKLKILEDSSILTVFSFETSFCGTSKIEIYHYIRGRRKRRGNGRGTKRKMGRR
jgi:hypothetical protein